MLKITNLKCNSTVDALTELAVANEVFSSMSCNEGLLQLME